MKNFIEILDQFCEKFKTEQEYKDYVEQLYREFIEGSDCDHGDNDFKEVVDERDFRPFGYRIYSPIYDDHEGRSIPHRRELIQF